MAIEKVPTRKAQFTPQALIELGVAAALVIVSLVFVLVGVGRWRMKRSIVAALENHDSNRSGTVAEECRDALARDDHYHLARQLLAKVLLDQAVQDPAKLAEAEKEYQTLLTLGYARAHVHVGLGIIHLVRADAATDKKHKGDLAAKARQAFQAARTADASCPEARIGLAHVELFLALRVKEDGDLTAARNAFEAIRKELESNADLRSKITREGLVDLYAGIARSYTSPSGYSPEADRYYRICLRYAPNWPVPLVNMAYIDAQRLVSSRFTKTTLNGDADLTALTQMLQALSDRPGADQASLKEAYLMRELAAAYAYGMAEDLGTFADRLGRLPAARHDGVEMRAHVWLDLVRRPTASMDAQKVSASNADQALRALLDHERVKDPQNRAERLLVLNAVGAMLERSGVLNNTAPQVAEAERYLLEALEIDKGNYVVLRNLAVVQRRLESMEPLLEQKPKYREQAKKYLEAARASAGSDTGKLSELKQIEDWNP